MDRALAETIELKMSHFMPTKHVQHARVMAPWAERIEKLTDGRYLFSAPITGVFEVTEFSMACLVFCALAYTQTRKGHVAVDIFVSRFPRKGQRIIDIITHLLSLYCFLRSPCSFQPK